VTKQAYMDALAAELGFMAADERDDIVREFDSHLRDAGEARPDLSEEELIDRLPPPASIAATYSAEFPRDAEDHAQEAGARGKSGRPDAGSPDRGGAHERFRDFFRYARQDEQELTGGADGVERVEVQSVACDVRASPGSEFSYAIRGRWDEDTKPAISQRGGLWRIDCERDADCLELTLPEGLVELIVTSASGDMELSLPSQSNAALRSASGDIALRGSGGSVSLSSASGDLALEGGAADAQLKSASGDIELVLSGACSSLTASTKSGDIKARVEDVLADIKLHSMSGDLELRLPEASRHELDAETVSGDIHSSRGTARRGVVGAKLRYGDGPAQAYAKTLSGDIRIA
jgi:hypothetical protein